MLLEEQEKTYLRSKIQELLAETGTRKTFQTVLDDNGVFKQKIDSLTREKTMLSPEQKMREVCLLRCIGRLCDSNSLRGIYLLIRMVFFRVIIFLF